MTTKSTSSKIGPAFRHVPNPFADVSEDERELLLQELGKENDREYKKSLEEVIATLKKYDWISLLSALSSYSLQGAVTDEGVKTVGREGALHQAHIEICQGLALQIPASDLGVRPFRPAVVQTLQDGLKALMKAYSLRRMALAGTINNDSEKDAIQTLQEKIRNHTQFVRNWGYHSQVKRLSRELYSSFDETLETRYGFTVGNVITLFEAMLRITERRNTERLEILAELRHSKDQRELLQKYCILIGESADDADRFLQESPEMASAPFKDLFLTLLSHYDLKLSSLYEFMPSSLADEVSLDEMCVRKILDIFSNSPGDLENYETEHLFLANPVWLKPVIRLSDDCYLCVLPQAFFSFVFPSLEALLSDIGEESLSKRRAKFLEFKVRAIIETRFPEADTISGLKWRIGGTEYETDVITFIGSHAVILEAKSGRISKPALRGAPESMQKHIDEILISPNIQSRRLAERMKYLALNPDIPDTLRDSVPVELDEIHSIVRISVSLEDFGSIQANVSQLADTGWLPADFVSCPTMSLADFETLFDLLEHPVQILHYLESRQELESKFGFMGDEVDLMGLYMATLFNLEFVDGDLATHLLDMSSSIDAYYISRDAGVLIEKPTPQMSSLFVGVLEAVEARKPPRWTEIGSMLHRISPDSQVEILKMVSELERSVRNNWSNEDHKNIALYIPPDNAWCSFCYVLMVNENIHKRMTVIENAGLMGLKPSHVKKCLVIVKNIDRSDRAYTTIGVLQ